MRTRWLARLVKSLTTRIAESRPPDFEVVRDTDKGVYLRRWWVIPRNRWFNVYLHNMLRDDDDILHDHMYWSLSLCLGGRLHERYQLRPPLGPVRWRHATEGTWSLRSPRMAHQLVVLEPAWTVFVTGPRVKEWGFWCPKGFRHWRDYVALSQASDGSGKGVSGRGVGCGEMS